MEAVPGVKRGADTVKGGFEKAASPTSHFHLDPLPQLLKDGSVIFSFQVS